MTSFNQSERISLLAQKWQEGTITPDERAEFERWYTSSDSVLAVNSKETREEAEARIYASILSRGGIRQTRARHRYRLLAAASVMIGVLIAGYMLRSRQNNELPVNKNNATVFTTSPGMRQSFKLSDGTLVTLNAASKLTILPGYNTNKREVLLDGEAYFTVTHNPKSPFSVHTVKFDVNDLGTVFNVKAYTGDKTSEAVLIKGSVEVVFKNRSKERVLLVPDKKLVISNDPITSELTAIDNKNVPHYKIAGIANNIFKNSIVETDWANNKLSFYDKPFDEIVPILERWYGVKLLIEDKQLYNVRFTGTFGNQNIYHVLNYLRYTQNFNFRKEGNNVIIY